MIKILVDQANYDAVEQSVKDELNKLSELLQKDIYVSSAYRAGDPKEHGKKLAVDVMCPALPLLDFFLAASRFKFKGIGVYPDWDIDGKGPKCGGLHLDMRDEEDRALWMGVKSLGKQVYIALSQANLRAHGVL